MRQFSLFIVFFVLISTIGVAAQAQSNVQTVALDVNRDSETTVIKVYDWNHPAPKILASYPAFSCDLRSRLHLPGICEKIAVNMKPNAKVMSIRSSGGVITISTNDYLMPKTELHNFVQVLVSGYENYGVISWKKDQFGHTVYQVPSFGPPAVLTKPWDEWVALPEKLQ